MIKLDLKALLPIKIHTSLDKKNSLCFIDNSFDYLKQLLEKYQLSNKKVCLITDNNIYELYSSYISTYFNDNIFWYRLSPGEFSKSDSNALRIIEFLLENDFNRDDFLVAFGGGVITDISGFVASIYKRGISFISIPTSLVAMTDSSVGGKNGVNIEGFKNEIGTFYNPLFVYINISLLKTLSISQIAEGMVEVIKTALVLDFDFFEYISSNLNRLSEAQLLIEIKSSCLDEFFFNIIYNSVLIKSKIVSEDPFDHGKRHLLNFGHTIGHSIEKCTGYKVTHGQAVSIGIICALKISVKKGLLDSSIIRRVSSMLNSLSMPTLVSQIIDQCNLDPCMADLEDFILYYIHKDKKQTSTGLKFVLLEGPGRGIISNEITEEDILGSF